MCACLSPKYMKFIEMSMTYTEKISQSVETSSKNDDKVNKHELKERVKDKFIDWSQSSTSHGYPNIFRTKNLIIKIMWLVFFLAGLGVSSYMVIRAVREFLEFNVTTTIRKIKADSLVFPAVSICHVNPFVTDEGAIFVLEYFQQKYGKNITTIADIKNVTENFDYDLESIRQIVASPNFDSTLRESFGFTDTVLMLTCQLNSQDCDYEKIERLFSLINFLEFNSNS